MGEEWKDNLMERRRLYNRMNALLTEIIMMDDAGLEDSSFSGRNLAHYLKLCANYNVELEEILHLEGMGTLRMAGFHVEHYLKKVIYNLGGPPCNMGHMYDWHKAKNLKRTRAERMFGTLNPGEHLQVMATLDIASTRDEIESLIQNGMNVARINCAHGSPGDWLQLTHIIKSCEETAGRCKIFMDIPGPKIRVEKILYNPYSVKIKSGKSNESIEGIIKVDSDSFTNDDFGAVFELEIKKSTLFSKINRGDELKLRLINIEQGTLKVIDILDENVLLVKADREFEISLTCKLDYDGHELEVTNIKTSPPYLKVKKGSIIRIYFNEKSFRRMRGNRQCACLTVSHPKALQNVGLNDSVFFDDGMVFGKVKRLTPDFIELLILAPNEKSKKIKEGKGINFPDSFVHLLLFSPTKEDLAILPFIIQHADIIGLSYVNHPKDIKKMVNILQAYGKKEIGLVAKIETKEGIRQMSRILEAGLSYNNFGIMIARGDLAVEAGFHNLYTIQENIMRMCQAAHIPVIWATGVLNELSKKGMPSRAEISDVYLAGKSDCIMLNKGEFLNDSVKLLKMLMQSSPSHNTYYREDEKEFFHAQFDLLKD